MTVSVPRSTGLGLLATALLLSGCTPPESGNAPGAGGQVGTGGTTSSTGGATAPGSGGAAVGTGGAASGTGGATSGSGGATSGSGGMSSGGAPGSGGAAAGGAGGASRGTGGAAGGAVGGRGGQTGTGGLGGGTTGMGGSRIAPATDYGAMGPFTPTTTEDNTGPGGKYFIYRPQNLGQNGFLHPPIIFGPGIGMEADATQLRGMLNIIASHGFVIIGTRLDGGPGAAANRTAMLDGLNWILQQNSTAGTYQGKLDVTHAVSMGYSVGGTSAVEIGSHAAVATTVSIHGHRAMSEMHGPLLQTSATGDGVGLPLQQQTYDLSKVQTFFGVIQGEDHGYIQRNNGGAERPAIIAWLRYWIYNDQGGKNYFYGDNCVMCGPPNWTTMFKRKNWQ